MANVPLLLLCAIAIADVAVCIVLLLDMHQWQPARIKWSRGALADFHGDTLDLLLMLVARGIIVALLTRLGVVLGQFVPQAQRNGAYSLVGAADPNDPVSIDKMAQVAVQSPFCNPPCAL